MTQTSCAGSYCASLLASLGFAAYDRVWSRWICPFISATAYSPRGSPVIDRISSVDADERLEKLAQTQIDQMGPRRFLAAGVFWGSSSESGETPAASSTLRETKTGSPFPSASAMASEGRASMRATRSPV